jgi:hypothetical protein
MQFYKCFSGFLLRLLDASNFDFDQFNICYFNFLTKREKLNTALKKRNNYSESENYVQSVPDRYSINIDRYKEKINFLNFQDLEKWTKGNYANNIVDINRYFFLNLCIDYLIEEGISGNVAEIGVYKGNSAYLLSRFAREQGKTCFLFDTFEGFNQGDFSGHDVNASLNAFSDTNLEVVKELTGEKNTVFVKGYFPESLNQTGEIENLVLVHLDCDLEKPMKSALEYFYPRIKKGGFLIMHDHSSLYWPGAQTAIDEFFKNKGEFVIPIPDKSGTCVIRKV